MSARLSTSCGDASAWVLHGESNTGQASPQTPTQRSAPCTMYVCMCEVVEDWLIDRHTVVTFEGHKVLCYLSEVICDD